MPIILSIAPLTLFPAQATPTALTTDNTSYTAGQISSLYERVERSVVQISPQFSEFDISRTPLPSENTAQGFGSGFVFDEQGHIVTNSHVVETINSTAQVTFSDGRSFVVPFEPLLLSVNDHGGIEDIAVMVSYKISTDIFYCLTCMQ